MLGPHFSLDDLQAHPQIGEVAEVGTTFVENARLKATEVSRQIRGLVLADDSGLEVDSLGDAPGIFSARYAGEGATGAENRLKLLNALLSLGPGASRTASFRCALVLAQAGRILATVEGTIEGRVLEKDHGELGFGYDPIFKPNGFQRTFAELNSEEKNAISHRGIAVEKLREFLQRHDLSSE